MIKVLPKTNDDIKFTGIVSQILNNSVVVFAPREVYLIQIDRRFDYKWMTFSNKFLGAVGVWRSKDLRIPPFVPEKVIEELYFQRIAGKFIRKANKRLHIHQTSEDNMYRKIKLLSDSALFLWYSGDTKINSQASLMVYSVSENIQNFWFVSFTNDKNWQIRGTRNISRNEVQNLVESNFSATTW